MIAVYSQGFAITSVGVLVIAFMTLDVGDMSNRMRNFEWIAFDSVESHRLLIVPKRNIVVMQIPLNLTEVGKSPSQLIAPCASPAKRNGVDQITLCVGKPILPSRLKSLL
jgi:hypothetical protein